MIAQDKTAKLARSRRLHAEQRFFLGFGRVWCEKRRPEFSRMLIRSTRTRRQVRVNGVVQNMPEFQKALGLQGGASDGGRKRLPGGRGSAVRHLRQGIFRPESYRALPKAAEQEPKAGAPHSRTFLIELGNFAFRPRRCDLASPPTASVWPAVPGSLCGAVRCSDAGSRDDGEGFGGRKNLVDLDGFAFRAACSPGESGAASQAMGRHLVGFMVGVELGIFCRHRDNLVVCFRHRSWSSIRSRARG